VHLKVFVGKLQES